MVRPRSSLPAGPGSARPMQQRSPRTAGRRQKSQRSIYAPAPSGSEGPGSVPYSQSISSSRSQQRAAWGASSTKLCCARRVAVAGAVALLLAAADGQALRNVTNGASMQEMPP